MHYLKKPSWALSENDVTSETLFRQRRQFIQQSIVGTLALGTGYFPTLAMANIKDLPNRLTASQDNRVDYANEPVNSFEQISQYNNFYELGTGKSDPVKNAAALNTDNWSIEVEGACDKPGRYDLESLFKQQSLEERIYRFRCVEAWSMVVPWNGVPLSALIKQFQPNSKAKYVAFETLYDPNNPLPGQTRRGSIDWPYREGLRIDEAMHPLTMMAIGVYGKPMPNQNGAPIRLVVPWKYGFKSIKSIVKIRFTEQQPDTSWNMLAPREYGFYSNVNPKVRHPRWSQARERRLGEFRKRKTLMFNGYEAEVADLYTGMSLSKYY